MYESLDVLRKYAEKLSPKLSSQIRGVHECLEPHYRSEVRYAQSVARGLQGCEREIVDLLGEVLRTRLSEVHLDEDRFFDVKRNAATIRNAELYYRSMVFGGPDSWNVRDHHMMNTLDALLLHHGETAKAVVWAHNTHIGDYHATDMVDEGYINLGGLARERYGIENVHLVGFGTYEGEVLAGHSWGAKPKIMKVPPAAPGSYENYLHETAKKLKSKALLLPEISSERLPSLSVRRGHRAIGVVYQTDQRMPDHGYVPTDLARRYDSFVFIDRTAALRDLAYEKTIEGTLPETWPTGL